MTNLTRQKKLSVPWAAQINDKSYRFLIIDFRVDFWLIITTRQEKNYRLMRLPAAAQSLKTLKS